MRRIALWLMMVVAPLGALWAQSVRSEEVLRIDGRNYYIHRVVADQSVADLATLYSLSDSEVMEENSLTLEGEALREGDVLRIPCYERLSRLQPKRGDERFDRYRPASGESLFKVAVDFAISLDTLVADNAGLDITNIHDRSSLNIRRSASGKTQLADIRAQSRRYAEMLHRLSKEYIYFTVEAGTTLYSTALALQVDVEELQRENGNPTLIYEGMVLKCMRTAELAACDFVAHTEKEVTDVYEGFNPEEARPLKVSLMLPLSDALGRVRGSFVEFYQGALLAAEDMKNDGQEVEIQLFDTKNSADNVAAIVEENGEMLSTTDLLIGPIYERNAESVIAYASERNIPVISPLASTTQGEYGRNYYRLVPTDSTRIDKLSGIVAPTTNVIMVYTTSHDKEMEQEVLSMLGSHPYGKVIYDEQFVVDSLQSSPIEELMAEEDNLFVVLSDNELEVDRSLAIISSMMNSRQPRYGTRRVPVRVLGNASWARYKNMDKNLLFKLDVCYLAAYHADRGNVSVREFDRRFMEAFGRAPSMFAYRAYDAVKLFASALFAGGDLTAELNGSVVPLLQTRYSFREERGSMVGDSWMLVNYRPNYRIEVK
ncbi:MAG: ABC transporter substrate-binding protein [Tidjanibacter sp.]|nr:ABC transporter substrate-binding protein [Tidjanibacter sp.]